MVPLRFSGTNHATELKDGSWRNRKCCSSKLDLSGAKANWLSICCDGVLELTFIPKDIYLKVFTIDIQTGRFIERLAKEKKNGRYKSLKRGLHLARQCVYMFFSTAPTGIKLDKLDTMVWRRSTPVAFHWLMEEQIRTISMPRCCLTFTWLCCPTLEIMRNQSRSCNLPPKLRNVIAMLPLLPTLQHIHS